MKKIFVFLTILLLSTGYAQNFDNNRFLLAQNLEQAGEYSKAREIYESLYRTDPGNTVYFQKLNDVYFELKLYDNVVSLISPKIAQSPDDLQLAGTLGKAWCLKGEEQKAFDLWDALLARIPMKSQAARIFAGICMEVRMVDKTISYLNKAKSFAGNDHSIGLELLNIYLQTMQYQNAAREAAEILGKAPDLISQVEVRVNPYLDRKELVTVLITEIEKANLKNQSGYRLLQKLYLEANDYENAFSDAKKLDDQQKRQGIDVYQLGILLYSRGAYEKAAEVFGYVQETYETSVLAASAELYGVRSLDAAQTMKLRSGINDWKPEKKEGSIPLGHRQEIISRYRRILSAPKPQDVLVEAKLRLASIYYEAGQFDSARYYAADIIRFNNMSHSGPEANFLMVKMLLKDRKADSCLTFYDNIIACPATAAPQRSAAKIGKGLLWCAAGNFEKARDLFRDVSSTPRDDNATDALEYLLLLNTDMNDSVLVQKYALAQLRLTAGDFFTADSLFSSINPDKNQVYLKSLVEIRQIETAIALDDYNKAISLTHAINQDKSYIFADKVSLYLGKIYLFGLKQPAEAKKVFETFLADYSSSIYSNEVRDLLKVIQGQSL